MSTQAGDKCAARQYSDQMSCAACRLTWDTNDTDPPPCPRLVKAPPVVRMHPDGRPEWTGQQLQGPHPVGFVSGCFRDGR